MAINKLISVKVPVLEALGDMGIDHGKNIPDFTRWAVRAEREIGSYYALSKQIEVLTVDKYRAELPCGAMYAQRVLLGDFGCNNFDLFNYVCTVGMSNSFRFNPTDTFLVVDKPAGDQDILVSPLKWEVQNNFIVFNADYDKQKVTVQYLGLEKDEDGFPKVCENHTEAIVSYIMFKFAQRSRFTPNKMDLGDVNYLRDQWGKQACEARAVDSEISESDREEMIAMIHDPLSGYGLEVGMHQRYDF